MEEVRTRLGQRLQMKRRSAAIQRRMQVLKGLRGNGSERAVLSWLALVAVAIGTSNLNEPQFFRCARCLVPSCQELIERQ